MFLETKYLLQPPRHIPSQASDLLVPGFTYKYKYPRCLGYRPSL